MADSCCIAELKETVERMNAELIRSLTKISELEAKVRKQAEATQKEMSKLQEENVRLARDLKEIQDCQGSVEGRIQKLEQLLIEKETELIRSEKKNNVIQKKLELAEQKLVEFSQKLETAAEGNLAQIKESNNDALDINSLPDEMILEVFCYLTQNQLGQIARVCRKWNELTKDPILWKEVNVKFSSSHGYQTTVSKSLINRLPPCVTSITLVLFGNWLEPLDFVELGMKLQEKCPHLEAVKLTHAELSECLFSLIALCTRFLLNVKNLTFHNCKFLGHSPRVEFSGTSKIEVLDLSFCNLRLFNMLQFSQMPYLKVLRLHFTNVNDLWFYDASFFNQLHVLDLGYTNVTFFTLTAVQNYGLNLKELYICRVKVRNHDFNFNNSSFPHLKTICFGCFGITCEGVVSLIQSCPSLQNVYVNRQVAESFAVHPFVVANSCKSGIVKAIKLMHKHDIDYMHEWILS